MATFKGAVLNCAECGDEFKVPACRAKTAKTCSKECADKQRGFAIERKADIACLTCGVVMRLPRCRLKRQKYCSHACQEAHPETIARKASRVGEKNGNWVGGRIGRKDRYIYLWRPDHPYASNGYVLEHRLVMEGWLLENEPDSPFLIEVKGRKVLSREYEVHHKDVTRTNNSIDNLECLTPLEHKRAHALLNRKALAYYREHVLNKGK